MPYQGGIYGGVYYSAGLVDDDDDVKALDQYLQTTVEANRDNTVVSIFMMPRAFYTTGTAPKTQNVAVVRPTKLQGYTPKNKKLLTYPYCFVCVDALNDSKIYRYEYSQDKTTIHFMLACAMSPNPEIVTMPRGYNGTAGVTEADARVNPTETVVCSGFPQCAFSIDSYRAWLSQRATGDLINMTGIALTGGLSMMASDFNINQALDMAGAKGKDFSEVSLPSPASVAAPGIASYIGILSQVNNIIMQVTQGAKARGSQGGSTEVGMRTKGVYFKQMCVTAEYARMIDDFFNRYGYSCCRIKVPNRNVRPHWTYTKTRDVAIAGSIPVDAMNLIKRIYDKGITFWRNPTEVGNYYFDNSPV